MRHSLFMTCLGLGWCAVFGCIGKPHGHFERRPEVNEKHFSLNRVILDKVEICPNDPYQTYCNIFAALDKKAPLIGEAYGVVIDERIKYKKRKTYVLVDVSFQSAMRDACYLFNAWWTIRDNNSDITNPYSICIYSEKEPRNR